MIIYMQLENRKKTFFIGAKNIYNTSLLKIVLYMLKIYEIKGGGLGIRI